MSLTVCNVKCDSVGDSLSQLFLPLSSSTHFFFPLSLPPALHNYPLSLLRRISLTLLSKPPLLFSPLSPPQSLSLFDSDKLPVGLGNPSYHIPHLNTHSLTPFHSSPTTPVSLLFSLQCLSVSGLVRLTGVELKVKICLITHTFMCTGHTRKQVSSVYTTMSHTTHKNLNIRKIVTPVYSAFIPIQIFSQAIKTESLDTKQELDQTSHGKLHWPEHQTNLLDVSPRLIQRFYVF